MKKIRILYLTKNSVIGIIINDIVMEVIDMLTLEWMVEDFLDDSVKSFGCFSSCARMRNS